MVFGVRSWTYPAVVLATCLLIVAILSSSPRHASNAGGVLKPHSWRWDVVIGGWLMICTWILTAGPLLSLPTAALAPPMFVSAFAWLARDDRTLPDGIRRWSVLVGAALAGSVAVRLAPDALTAGVAGLSARSS